MIGESTPSFVMGIVAFSLSIMILLPIALNFLYIAPTESTEVMDKSIKSNLKENNILEDKQISPTKVFKIFLTLFTFNAENYGLSIFMSRVVSLTISICFYSAIIALASIYWPILIVAGIAGVIQSLSISDLISLLRS